MTAARAAGRAGDAFQLVQRRVVPVAGVVLAGRLRLKDTLYGLKLAEKFAQDTPLGNAARDAFRKLLDQGLGDLNESKVIDVLRS